MSHTSFIKSACLLFALILVASCKKEGKKLLPGISKELATQRKHELAYINYRFSFQIPEKVDESIFVKAKYAFAFKTTPSDLILDFNAPDSLIKGITKNGQPIPYTFINEHIVVTAEHLNKIDTLNIELQAGEQSLNRHEDYLYTLFVPERASTCMPVMDQPDIKSTFELELDIPKQWQAISSTVGNESVNGNRKIVRFKRSKPISSYLFSFAAGNFKVVSSEVDGRAMKMYHRETDTVRVKRNIEDIFKWHALSASWLEAYTDIEYPFDKLEFVLLPSFQYGGMEHPGNIFYKASSLFLEESSTLNQQLGRARLIAHETAHMWFGNLVTMEWFNEVWLKEVFANFMAAKIVNPRFDDIDHNLNFLMAHYPSAYAVDRTKGTHPIQQQLKNLKDAGSVYGSIIYQKSPIVLRMLEEAMGPLAFQSGMREYLQTYRQENATWADLISILDKHTTFDVQRWNRQWVVAEGMPHVRYNITRNPVSDQVKNFKVSARGGKRKMDNAQDLRLLWKTSDTLHYYDAPLLTAPGSFNLKGEPWPQALFTNAGGKGYGYFFMGEDSKRYALDSTMTISSPVVRGAIWINIYESVLRGDVRPHEFMKSVLRTLTQEKEPLILNYLTHSAETIFWQFYTPEARDKLAPQLEAVLLNLAVNAPTQDLKSTFFRTLTQVALTDNTIELLTKIWSKETSLENMHLSEQDYKSLAYELAVREVPNYREILTHQLERISNPDRRAKMEFVIPALSANSLHRDQFMRSLEEPAKRENEEWVLEALAYIHHPLRTHHSVKYIPSSLELLEQVKMTGDIFFPKRWLDRTLGGHQSEEAANAVRQFLYANNKYPADLKLKILQSADLLFRSVDILKHQKDGSN